MEEHYKNLPWRLLYCLLIKLALRVCVCINIDRKRERLIGNDDNANKRERDIEILHTCIMKGAILKHSPAVEIDELFSSPINL